MERIRYGKVYPKSFGTMLVAPAPKQMWVTERDMAMLENLRDHFWKREGDALSWKEDLKPVRNQFPGLHTALEVLWGAGLVLKFAKSFHTQSRLPQYIQWYIWGEE